MNRVDVIKSRHGEAKRWMTPVRERRDAVASALVRCPGGRWIAVDDLFPFLRAGGDDFEMTRGPWRLYMFDRYHGSLGYHGRRGWGVLQGRHGPAFLFEYAAAMRIVDAARLPPPATRVRTSAACGDRTSCRA